MRGRKFRKGVAVALAAMMVATVVPAMAEEYVDTQETEEKEVITEPEIESEAPEEKVIQDTMPQVVEDTEVSEDNSPQYLEDGQGDDSDDADENTPTSDEDIPNEVTTITLHDEKLTLNINDSYLLTVTIEPEPEETPELIWTSSDENIVSIDETDADTCTIGALKAGTATVSVCLADDQDCSASCVVTVPFFDGFSQAKDGNWYYYEKGAIATGTTSVIKDTVGTIGARGSWWNVVKGMVTPGVTVAKNSNGWWYINEKGMVDFTYDGFAKNDNGTWYCEDGKVDFSINSVCKDTTGAIGAKGNWYYVVGNRVQTSYTGVANYKNANGWWYIKNGQVDFTANTVAKNNNGWWYVSGGKVIFSYKGFGSNSNGQWYCEGGKVKFNKNSVIQDTTGAIGARGNWYYVVGSKVQTDFTGLANYRNSNGWWYIKNGKVDFTHNGVDKNKNGWYYVTGGKVQLGFTGLANYKNSNGWWYIKNGKVDFTHTGVDKNKNGWYYVSGGKVDFSFNGLASNSNGQWVIQNGKVDFSYNGSYTYQGVTYTVTNGKAAVPLGMSTSMYNKAQSQSSSTKWLILVDVTNCKLGVFQGSYGSWSPTKYWTCSTGASATPTKLGTYSIIGKGKSFGDGFTCWYYSQFYGNYLIHSILYNQGSMTSVQDGRLGEHVSHGCVRLALENAKWIYDNVPYGTRVLTY